MRYQHSLEIHERLESVLELIRAGKYSTPGLAEKVGVSIPTISRIVAALRARGHAIRSERHDGGWRYVLDEQRPGTGQAKRSRTVGSTNREAGYR
jgi:predicted DNA-binding transcriptional regulator YafY